MRCQNLHHDCQLLVTQSQKRHVITFHLHGARCHKCIMHCPDMMSAFVWEVSNGMSEPISELSVACHTSVTDFLIQWNADAYILCSSVFHSLIILMIS